MHNGLIIIMSGNIPCPFYHLYFCREIRENVLFHFSPNQVRLRLFLSHCLDTGHLNLTKTLIVTHNITRFKIIILVHVIIKD